MTADLLDRCLLNCCSLGSIDCSSVSVKKIGPAFLDFILGGDAQFGLDDFTQSNQGSVAGGGNPSDSDPFSTAFSADGRNDGSSLIDSAQMF